MDDLARRLRELIDNGATPVTGPEIRDRATPRSRPRQLVWVAAAVVLVLVLVVAGVAIVSRRPAGDDDVVVSGTRPTGAPTAAPSVETTSPVELLATTELALPGSVTATVVSDAVVEPGDPSLTPARTEWGVVVAVRPDPSAPTDLVLVKPDGQRTVLARRITGFAVDAAGQRVAVGIAGQDPIGAPGSTTTLQVLSLPGGEIAASTSFSGIGGSVGYAAPEAWAGHVVLVNTGDGAGSRAATWVPGTDHVTVIEGAGTVAAAWPAADRALVNQNDGDCAVAIQVARTGNAEPAGPAAGFGCGRAAVAPDGSKVAIVDTDAGISVVDSSGAPVWTSTLADGATAVLQVLWTDIDELAIVRSDNSVVVCTVGGVSCATAVPGGDRPVALLTHPVIAPEPAPTGVEPPDDQWLLAINPYRPGTLEVIDARDLTTVRVIEVVTPTVAGQTPVLEFVDLAPSRETAVVTEVDDPGGRISLVLVDLDGGAVTEVATNATWPAFSPDGATLAYVEVEAPETRGRAIVLQDLATGTQRRLDDPDRLGATAEGELAGIGGLAWSPDGEMLAYSYGFEDVETRLIDVATAQDLSEFVVHPDIVFLDWVEADRVIGAQRAAGLSAGVVVEYDPTTESSMVLDLAASTGRVDVNDLDGRLLAVQSAATPTVWITLSDGAIVPLIRYRVPLIGYSDAAW
ncbi:MAG: PD40 domain-containing protein [Acidimicrobiales bacterium]|nr:PD40 domain-containing protein [Acidimicrobiales bacterium]